MGKKKELTFGEQLVKEVLEYCVKQGRDPNYYCNGFQVANRSSSVHYDKRHDSVGKNPTNKETVNEMQ